MRNQMMFLIGFFTALVTTACSDDAKLPSVFQVPSGASLILDAHTLAGVANVNACGSSTWDDISGNGNDGSLTCGTGVSGTGTTVDPYRIAFDGHNTYVSTALDVQSSTMPETTWIVWMKTSTTAFSHLMSADNHGGAFNRSLVINNVASSGNIGAFNRHNNVYEPFSFDDDTWTFLTVVYTADDVTVYKNGSSLSLGHAPNFVDTVQTLTIGRSAGGGFEYFTGDMAWVAVYPRALSEEEVDQTCRALVDRFDGASCD